MVPRFLEFTKLDGKKILIMFEEISAIYQDYHIGEDEASCRNCTSILLNNGKMIEVDEDYSKIKETLEFLHNH